MWTICFVDIVVSYDFFCAAVQRINFVLTFYYLVLSNVGE